MSGALKDEADHILITFHGDNDNKSQNGDASHVPWPCSSTKALTASFHMAS